MEPRTAGRRVVVEQTIGATVVNFLLNGGIAWGMFRGDSAVPLWGATSIASDMVSTGFLLPLLMGLIVSRIVHREVESGRAAALPRANLPAALRALPASSRRRSLVLGVFGALVAAPVAVGVMWALGVEAMSPVRFALVKAILAAALAATLAPPIVWTALADRHADS